MHHTFSIPTAFPNMHAKLNAFLCVGLLAIAVAPIRAIEPIGDDSELFITGVATVAENDNIFLNHSNTTSATVFDLVPGLSYEFGKNNALTKGLLAANEDFQIFSKSGSSLNNQLANIVGSLAYDDTKTKLNFDASFHQADQAQVGIQNLGYLVDRNLYHMGGTGEVAMTDKSSLGTGILFDDTDYRAVGFTDYRYVELPVNYYFKFEPKLDLSAGFRYRDNTVGTGGIDSTDLFYNVGARGEFTPNLTGELLVGYQQQNLDNGTNQGGLGLDSRFTYVYDTKTSLSFGVNDDFSYVATGPAIREFEVYLEASTALTEQWSIDGRVSYNRYTYITTPQRDDYYTARVGVTYVIATYLKVSAAYSYAEDNSNLTIASFKNNIISVSASVHY